ncbi:AAA family ATPase [Hymenobacter sp. BT186]|uniref:AAA family ATPase n=1 Tax=Hymenobacter telluris TaxID=2816474 RepID=A0A939F3T6_9BACT|nr:AAA family ATPase [Hymenobacter telluris]MBO0360878.1 AAA family ATPase [Hymenobacter telluris]MBW3376907.1 AAA family ATPase [Hymenobacter norwichensis]
MIIKSIELNNFRIYRGHNVVDLSPKDGQNIYVISGKNGFGKTTFLMSLVWCLYGRQMHEVDDLYKREIDEKGGYAKYIVTSLNRQAKAEEDTSFSVKLTLTDAIIPALTCSEITIKRTYNTRTASEDLEILIDGFENELIQGLSDEKARGEEHFIRDYLLPIEIAKFFFFDAEKIVSLAEVNTNEQRKKLSRAYSEILGIKKYEDTKTEIEETQLRLRARTANARERGIIDTLDAEITGFRDSIDSNTRKIEDLKNERTALRFESDEIQKKLIRFNNLITLEELEVLRSTGQTLETRLSEVQAELAKSYDLVPFAIAASKLGEVVEQVNLEAEYKEVHYKQGNASVIEEKILNGLSEEIHRSGISTDDSLRDFYNTTFRKLIKEHLISDAPDFPADFRLLHDLTESERAQLLTMVTNLKLSFREQFKRLHFEYNQTRNELIQINRRIVESESLSEDAVVKADRQRKRELDEQIESLAEQIGRLNQANEGHQNSIVQREKQLEGLRKKLKASEQDKEKDLLTEALSQRLRDYIVLYKERKKKSLEQQILKGLGMLMHKKGFVKNVEVRIMGDLIEIELYNKRGEVILKEGLSKGEQQLYATALLYGLVEESDFDFPVFIDSPMQKFDDQHAENIVKHFYPSIADQVILFPLINKELSAREYDLLLPRVAKSYLIINKDSDESGFEEVVPDQLFERYSALYHS